ncbi:hypothetical protein AK812_SmicGene33029 [Symbiodinium microadriaticum]|uniref:Peptidase C14 caspase domain-containing protein n=1 Tax=Symbiodinium microadriaticum TaxID=2951 RepID=A0A1Q9CSQ7_SYMMI|nr:hypothetical protein AK812_SmicGene33029 [Symbiodinium microadriaticum]
MSSGATMPERRKCVWAVISNDHVDIPRAFRGAQRLHGHLSAGPQGLLVESAVAIFNKSTGEICEELSQAATCLDSHGLSKIFFVYYAGHVVSDEPDFYYIEPIPGESNMDLTCAAMKSVSNQNLEGVNTTVFLDGCAKQVGPQEEEEAVESHWTNTFTTLCCASFGHGVWDGAILERCLEHCCELKFATVDDFLNGVRELTRQLSFGGLCARHIHPTELNPLLELPVLKEHTSGGTCFLRFALHLWTDEWLESDDHQEVDLSPLIRTLRAVVCLLVTCDMWSGADAWGELQVLACCQSLDDVLVQLQKPDREIGWKLQCDSVPEYIRKYLVEAVVEAVRAWHNQNGILDEPPDVEDVVERLGSLCSRITEWYELYEGTPDATGDRRYRFLKVEGAVPEQFTEAEMQETAAKVEEVCQYFGIRAQVCLVPGSLWAIFCSEEPPNPDQRKGFCEKFGRWVEERRKSGVRGWSRAEPPCWKPSHAVPSRIRNVVQKVQNFVDTDSGSAPCCMWLRACALRRLVARSCSQRNPEERCEAWRVVIFEGLSEIRGSAWLQGAGDLRCAVLRNLRDESFGEQLTDLVGVADRRGLQMRPEIPALLFLAQEAGVELQQEDLVQVMASGGQEVLRSYVKQFIREVLSQRQDAKLKTGKRGIDVDSTIRAGLLSEKMTCSHISTTESTQFLIGDPAVPKKAEDLPAVPASSTSLRTALGDESVSRSRQESPYPRQDSVSRRRHKNAANSIALVISCSDYFACSSLPALPKAKLDADEVYSVLRESGVDIAKRSENISRSQVVAEFVDLLQEVMGTDASVIYVFFAGHHCAIDQTACYCGSSACGGSDLTAPLTNFPLQDLVQVLQKVHTWERPITNARAIIMLDCCTCWSDWLTPWPDCCSQRAGQASIVLLAAGDPATECEGGGNFTQALCRHWKESLFLPELSSRIWSSVCSHTRYRQRPFGLWRADFSSSSVLPGWRVCRADLPALRPQASGRRHALVLSCVRFFERGKVQFDMESQRSGESMAKLLKELGYHVLHFQNPDQETVQAALKTIQLDCNNWPTESDAESTTFIFYAGPVFQDEVGELMMLFIDPSRGRQQVFHLGKWILDLQHNFVPRTFCLKAASAPGRNMMFAIDGCSKRPRPESTRAEEPTKDGSYKYKYKGGLCCILSCAVSQHDRRDFSESLLGHLRIAKSAADLCDGISADCRNSGSRPWIMSSGDLSAISLGTLHTLPDEAAVARRCRCARRYARRYRCRRCHILFENGVIAPCFICICFATAWLLLAVAWEHGSAHFQAVKGPESCP